MADNLSRYAPRMDHVSAAHLPMPFGEYMERLVEWSMEVSLKQLYGWALYGAVLLLLLFLLYDMPVRRELKLMPLWRTLRREMDNLLPIRGNRCRP